jgi:predicted amidophosphoribosyltransferase
LVTTAVPILVKRLELDPSRTVFVPALSSSETIASEGEVLPVMARACAEAAGTAFVPNAITKKAHQPLHNVYNAEKRREILDGAEYRSRRIKAQSILIFDDFITRGDTLSHIAQAIHEANQGITVYGVGLGKTERRSYYRERFDVKISNDHVPAKWADLWGEGEAQ